MDTSTANRAVEEAARRYFVAWNEADTAARRAIAAEAFTDQALYTDPLSECQGPEGFCEMVEQLRVQNPDAIVGRTSGIETHHHVARFDWEIAGADGRAQMTGIDVLAFDHAGRIERVIGFMGKQAPAIDHSSGS